jgi:hypothetical protein
MPTETLRRDYYIKSDSDRDAAVTFLNGWEAAVRETATVLAVRELSTEDDPEAGTTLSIGREIDVSV